MSKHWSKLNRPYYNSYELLQSCNPNYYAFGHDQFKLAAWIEGGEWPSYIDDYAHYTLSTSKRHIRTSTPASADTIADLTALVLDNDFSDNTSFAVQAPIATTTGAVCVDIAYNVSRPRQFIVNLSTATSIEVALNAKCTMITSIQSLVTRSPCNGIYSVSSGLFLHILLSGMLKKTDMIIVNSPNSMVLTSSLLIRLLNRSKWHTIVVTPHYIGDSSINVTTHKKLRDVDGRACHNLLGPTNVTQLNSFPNEHAGTVLLPDDVFHDTRVRLDPIMHFNDISYNTRKLISEDVVNVQLVSIGNRDRLSVKSNHTTKISQCKLYYDILHLIMMMSLGLHKGDITLARNLWRRNGFPTPNDAAILPLSLAPYRIRDKSDIRIGYDHSVASDWMLARYKYPYNPDLYGCVRQSICSAAMCQAKSVNGKFTVILTVTQVKNDYDSSFTSIVNTSAIKVSPDQNGNISYTECKMLRKPMNNALFLKTIWKEYKKMVEYQDVIYIDTIPFVDERQVNYMSKDDARQVLASKLLPSYSEQEANSVLALWNDYAARHKNKAITDLRHVTTFVNYFFDRDYH